jgi:hypothetical protein
MTMDWLIENWVLVALIGGMGAMHLFGHGHGGHRDGKSSKQKDAADNPPGVSSDMKGGQNDA